MAHSDTLIHLRAVNPNEARHVTEVSPLECVVVEGTREKMGDAAMPIGGREVPSGFEFTALRLPETVDSQYAAHRRWKGSKILPMIYSPGRSAYEVLPELREALQPQYRAGAVAYLYVAGGVMVNRIQIGLDADTVSIDPPPYPLSYADNGRHGRELELRLALTPLKASSTMVTNLIETWLKRHQVSLDYAPTIKTL